MADGAVSFLIERVVALLDQEMEVHVGLSDDLEKIKQGLNTLKAILEVAEKKQVHGVGKQWILELRELAYDMEDVLDDLMLHVHPQSLGSSSWSRFLHNLIHHIPSP
uniref:Disease resistance N-terminal domain-containing protein n=1 Tax=Nelumbo nucifera TaxID=4432 RepID=A0A822ZEX5_NELNU|nr:TPA_asm: hypothetical protein HUJ06_000229 [Nelumbo nucifera]